MVGLRPFVFIFLLIGILSRQAKPKALTESRRAAFSPKDLQKIIERLSPVFSFTQTRREYRENALPDNTAIEAVLDTLNTTANSDEGWLTFGKRLASLFLTGSKNIENEKSLNKELARKLYDYSPQFIKDSIQVQLDRSLLPTLERKVQDIIKNIKERKEANKNAQDKQLTPFDPFVFGANSMLNLMYFSAINTAMLSNMGLENLFNPDFDFDYDSLNEDEEKEEVVVDEEEKEENKGTEAEGEMTKDEKPEGQAMYMVHNKESSYSHYPGQMMGYRPLKYQHFKLYRPNKHF